MYRYILFDLDGTLTDPKLGITSCVQYALRKFGIEEPDSDKLEPFIGPPLLDNFRDFYGFDDAKRQQAISYYKEPRRFTLPQSGWRSDTRRPASWKRREQT